MPFAVLIRITIVIVAACVVACVIVFVSLMRLAVQ